MSYVRATVIDPNPGGSTRKQAILDLDTDTTGIFANLNTHEALTTGMHGITAGDGSIVGTAKTQTLTNKTVSGGTITGATIGDATLTGTITASSATITGVTLSNAVIDGTLSSPSITGGTSTNMTITTPSLTGGSLTNSTITTPTLTGTVTASGATISSPTITAPTIHNATLTGTLAINLPSSADGDIYYRASSALARLAKAASPNVLLAGDAPSWGRITQVLTATYDLSTASGTQDITGCGFDPTFGIVLAGKSGTYFGSIGMWKSGGTPGCLYTYQGTTIYTYFLNNASIVVQTADGGSSAQTGVISAITDGVRITWTKAGSASGTANITLILGR